MIHRTHAAIAFLVLITLAWAVAATAQSGGDSTPVPATFPNRPMAASDVFSAQVWHHKPLQLKGDRIAVIETIYVQNPGPHNVLSVSVQQGSSGLLTWAGNPRTNFGSRLYLKPGSKISVNEGGNANAFVSGYYLPNTPMYAKAEVDALIAGLKTEQQSRFEELSAAISAIPERAVQTAAFELLASELETGLAERLSADLESTVRRLIDEHLQETADSRPSE